jgi:hypothetical protein
MMPAPARWQRLLDRHSSLFGDLDDGCRIGIARRADVGTEGAEMVVWEAQGGRLVALSRPFPGYRDAGVDVLLVGDDEALGEIAGELDGDALPVLKRLVRRGNMVCYVLRRQCELIEAGYEDVLQSMGVAFAGACR